MNMSLALLTILALSLSTGLVVARAPKLLLLPLRSEGASGYRAGRHARRAPSASRRFDTTGSPS
jgi:hypothetical protein